MTCFSVHFFFIIAVCLRETFSLFASAPNVFPEALQSFWQDGEQVATTVLGQRLEASNPFRNGVAAYLHSAGIESGYAFFAPDVPANYKLVFELHYSDGRTEYDLPHVGSSASGLRLGGLLDQIAAAKYEPLRQMIIKILTYSIWEAHPDAISIRAVFGQAKLPTLSEFQQGSRETYELLYTYDFVFREADPPLRP